jgi:hypothetical protein
MGDPVPEVAAVNKPPRGAGGTPGGIGLFFFGVAMVAGGGYLILNQVTVTSHFSAWGWPGGAGGGFGPLLLALAIGVGILFFNAKNWLGRILSVGALGGMVVSVIMNLQMFWAPTTLAKTLTMFILLAGGLGLIARSFKASPQS